MDIQNFIKLDDRERVRAALAGTFITERQDGDLCILLYHLGDFFAEVKFNTERSEISRIRPFNTPSLLEPYLENLDIRVIIDN